VISIFGKSWDFHVKRALGIQPGRNLTIIAPKPSATSKNKAKKWCTTRSTSSTATANRDRLLRTLEGGEIGNTGCAAYAIPTAAPSRDGGLPDSSPTCAKRFDGVLGVHPRHNDSDITAVANALAAVEAGAAHVYGAARAAMANAAAMPIWLRSSPTWVEAGAYHVRSGEVTSLSSVARRQNCGALTRRSAFRPGQRLRA